MKPFLIALAVLILASCSGNITVTDVSDPAFFSDTLIAPKDSLNIKYSKRGTLQKTEFTAKEAYPLKIFLSELPLNLRKKGWYPLSYDYWQPQIALNLEWSVEEGTESKLHRIRSQWMNATGDILWYIFESDEKNSINSPVRVTAGIFPAEIAQRSQEMIK